MQNTKTGLANIYESHQFYCLLSTSLFLDKKQNTSHQFVIQKGEQNKIRTNYHSLNINGFL